MARRTRKGPKLVTPHIPKDVGNYYWPLDEYGPAPEAEPETLDKPRAERAPDVEPAPPDTQTQLGLGI